MISHDVIRKLAFFSALFGVAVLSLAPRDVIPETGVSDKLGHFVAYGVLTGLGLYAYRGKTEMVWIAMGLVAYGIVLEILQKWVPGRFFAFDDIVANTLGVLAGYGLVILLRRMGRLVS